MDKDLILKTIEPHVASRGCFIVDLSVSKDNDVTLTVEKEHGEVDLEDCVALNDAFLSAFDKDAEDYSLTVSSAGILSAADDEGITLRYTQKETVEGKKKKITVEKEETFGFADVNSVSPKVDFKK